MSCVGALWRLLPAGSMDLAAQVWPLAVFERGSRAARQHGRHLPQHRARARVVPAQRARLRQASRAARAHLGGKSRASTNCPLVAPSVSGLTWLPHVTTAGHGRPTALGRRVRPPAQARLARLARLARSASAHRVPWGWGDEWRLPPAQERTGQSSLPNLTLTLTLNRSARASRRYRTSSSMGRASAGSTQARRASPRCSSRVSCATCCRRRAPSRRRDPAKYTH